MSRICDSLKKTFSAAVTKRSLIPGPWLAPTPVVMISTNSANKPNLKPNIITVTLACTINSTPPIVGIGVRPDRHSYDAIINSGEFVVNLVNRDLLSRCDYCGVTSGQIVDKFSDCGLTPISIKPLKYAPAIAESPVNLACRVVGHTPLPSHDLILGEVVAIEAADSLFDDDDNFHLEKADLVAYIFGQYHELGKILDFTATPSVQPKGSPRIILKS